MLSHAWKTERKLTVPAMNHEEELWRMSSARFGDSLLVARTDRGQNAKGEDREGAETAQLVHPGTSRQGEGWPTNIARELMVELKWADTFAHSGHAIEAKCRVELTACHPGKKFHRCPGCANETPTFSCAPCGETTVSPLLTCSSLHDPKARARGFRDETTPKIMRVHGSRCTARIRGTATEPTSLTCRPQEPCWMNWREFTSGANGGAL